jgi:hypothetical protein
MNGEDVRKLLRRRYASQANGVDWNSRPGEQWVQIEEARSGPSWRGSRGQCDFLAIGAWESTGHVLIGHEIKVTYADWRREVDRPAKSELFRRYCHRWWLVAPEPVIDRARDDADPNLWGLMAATESRLVIVRPSPVLHPEPVPWSWAAGWLAQLQRGYERRGLALERTPDLREADPTDDTRTLFAFPTS